MIINVYFMLCLLRGGSRNSLRGGSGLEFFEGGAPRPAFIKQAIHLYVMRGQRVSVSVTNTSICQ